VQRVCVMGEGERRRRDPRRRISIHLPILLPIVGISLVPFYIVIGILQICFYRKKGKEGFYRKR